MANNLLTDNLLEPLNGTKAARIEINSEEGNLTIDKLTGGEPVLASGTLEYFENEGPPTHTLDSSGGKTILTVKGTAGKRSWFHLPWQECGGNEWHLHLNPEVSSDITAHSGGGNVKLDLSGMTVTHLAADTGAGNMEVVLPENADNLAVGARTGAGNVTVDIGGSLHGTGIINTHSGAGSVTIHVPAGIPARIHARSGMGKVIIDPHFNQVERETYQSPEYDNASDKLEITARSGAGNVSVDTK